MVPRVRALVCLPVVRVAALLLLAAAAVAPAQDLDIRAVARFAPTNGNLRAIATDGNRVYAFSDGFTGPRLLILDTTDPAHVQELGALAFDARVEQVCAAGDRVYLAAGFWGLIVVDVSHPTQPRELSRHFSGETITSVAADGPRICIGNSYFGSANSGVLILDATDSVRLAPIGRVAGVYPRSIALHGTTIVGCAPGTFFTADISNPAQPLPARTQSIEGDGRSVFIAGDTAYVASGVSGLYAFDLAAAPPRPVFRYQNPSRWTYRQVAVAGTRAYLSGEYGGLEVLDLSSPSEPVRVGTFPALTEAPSVAVDGPRLLLSAGQEGLFALEASLPAQIRRLGQYSVNLWGKPLVADGRAYVPGLQGVDILDIRRPGDPTPLGTIAVPAVKSLLFVGTNLFVNSDHSGVHVLLVNNPQLPWHIGGVVLTTGAHAGPMALVGTNLVVMDPWGHQIDPVGTLNVVNLRSLTFPEQIGDWDEASDYSPGFALNGSIAYVAGRRHRPGPEYSNVAALSIVDLSDPRQPADLGFREPIGHDSPRFAHLVGHHLYVGDFFGGIAIFDVSVPTDPREVGSIALRGYGWDMESANGYGYVALGDGGIAVLDLTDPAHPTLVTVNSSFHAESVTVVDGIAYAGSAAGGLQILSTFAPSPRLELLRAGSDVRLSIRGVGSAVVPIEKADSLSGPWTAWRSVTLTNGQAEISEPIQPARIATFYRTAPAGAAP